MFNKKEYNKQWRRDNPEKIRERDRERKGKLRQYVRDYKLDRGCSICGYNRCAEALEFHHNGDKEFNIATYIRSYTNIEKIKEEMKKCIVLCSNCHRELHALKREG